MATKVAPAPVTPEEAPTVQELGIQGDIAKKLAELDSLARNAGSDEAVGEVDVDGMTVRRKGQRSLVRMGNRELPERVKVYDRFGVPSLVPTALITYHLSKVDNTGQRVFFADLPEGVVEPVPLDITCRICLKRNVRKRFYEEYDYEGHMDSFHPREWAIMLRREEKEARAVSPGMIAAAVASMGDKEKQALRLILGLEGRDASSGAD